MQPKATDAAVDESAKQGDRGGVPLTSPVGVSQVATASVAVNCASTDCNRPVYCKGVCSRCYQNARNAHKRTALEKGSDEVVQIVTREKVVTRRKTREAALENQASPLCDTDSDSDSEWVPEHA